MRAVYRNDTRNVGDLMSPPARYFDLGDFAGTIYGGGVLLRHWDEPKPWVAWGVGASADGTKPGPMPEGFTLYGSRDFNQDGAIWVPCASCMSGYFDLLREDRPLREAVLYVNAQRDEPAVGGGLPMMNNEQTLGEALGFLASGEVVVTNSYHGAYWATLLGRKVVVVGAYSSKFYGLKHPLVLTDGDWREAVKYARVYPEALEECRAANEAFYARVMALVN